ncbi:MAG: sugar ABC transporter substrate-binding protein, partial [Acidimicrobiales bacterium]
QLHGKGNVLGVNISLPVPSLDAFIASEKQDVTSANPGIHWVGTAFDQTDDIAGADSSVASALTKYHNKVQAVMAYFDGAAIGAARALQSVGVKNVVIVGQQGNTDGIQAVKDGTISATINEMPYQQALIAFTMVKDLLAGKTVPLVIHPPVQFITKSNLSQYVPWTTGIQEIADGKLTPPTSLSSQPGA